MRNVLLEVTPVIPGNLGRLPELAVGLPKNNLTILGLAKKRAHAIRREPLAAPASERRKLATLLRYKPVTVKHAWAVSNTKNKGVETLSFQFQLSNDLAAAGVLVKAISALLENGESSQRFKK